MPFIRIHEVVKKFNFCCFAFFDALMKILYFIAN